MSEPSDGEHLALAVHPREERAALYRGPHEFTYPLVFEGVRGEDLEIDSDLRRMWFEMFGWEWIVVPADGDAAEVVETTVESLRDGDDFKAAFEEGLSYLVATVCNNCGHGFESEGSGGDLGPTCPECGHPADDPKIHSD